MTDSLPTLETLESRPRPRRRRLPPMSVMPTLCTLSNLVAGFAAIHYAAKPPPPQFTGPWGWSGLQFAATLIFVGMLLDSIDGWVARLTRSASTLGGHLDSLADAITFGVAPAFLTLQVVGQDPAAVIIGPEADDVLGKVVWAVAVVYLCCAALRLARFNVEAGPGGVERSGTFRGLPSPGAAGAVASMILLHQDLEPTTFVRAAALGIPLITIACAFGMVSSIPYLHITNRYIYGARSFGYVARLVVLLALLIWFWPETLALLFSAYALSGPVRLAVAKWRRIAAHKADSGNGQQR